MPETDTERSDALPADPEKRESMKTMAAAAMGVALFTDASWWPWGGDDGLGEALRILNDGEPVDDGVEELDFGNAITVQKTEDGVKLDVQQDFSGDVTADGAVGIGTRDPDGVMGGTFEAGDIALGISGTGDRRFASEAFVDSPSDAVQWHSAVYRGTKSSPSAMQDGDLLFNLSTMGYDGTALRGGVMKWYVDGPVSQGVLPTKLALSTEDTNGNTNGIVFTREGTWQVQNGAVQSLAGGATYGNGALELGSNGARLELNASGEVVAIDEAGNETLLS